MVVVALLSIDLVESVDLVSVYLVVNCIYVWEWTLDTVFYLQWTTMGPGGSPPRSALGVLAAADEFLTNDTRGSA